MSDKIKVLVVDDSPLVRKIITDMLIKDPQIEIVGTAENGKVAISKNDELDPDIITLDIEMPIMDGLTALREIIKNNPKPVIMMSVLTQHGAEATFKALDYGAVDFIPKPSSVISLTVDDISDLLRSKVKSVYKSNFNFSKSFPSLNEGNEDLPLEKKKLPAKNKSPMIVGIGTSTGGPSALMNVFKKFPDDFPSPVVVVQHMPEGFTKAFSERLNDNSCLNVTEAEDGTKVLPGCAYIAPGDSHMVIEKSIIGRTIKLNNRDKVSGHRPSIDVLFDSLADNFCNETIAVIMTGMGRDGAKGIHRIKDGGGYTIAQDEESSVVFGMNRVAVEEGAIDDIIPLIDITKKIVEHI